MRYTVTLKNKTSALLQIDSVKSIADTSKLDFKFQKNENGVYEISLEQSLKKPEKCKTCRDSNPKISDLTKGVIVYYRRGDQRSILKFKKFKQLPDINIQE